MHQSFFFAVMEDLLDFLTGDFPIFSSADEEFRGFA